ncbi:MAG: alanine racemase [Ruminococcus sp.]|nr:alanine racemase [Ruminococcus sp.]
MDKDLIFTRRLWAEINMDSIKHNYRVIKEAIGDTKLCCVVKADGYGHGAVEICKTYHELGVDFLAVSNLDEALELRRADINEPILILGFTPPDRCVDLSRYHISQAVYGSEYAELLSEKCALSGVEVKIHVKLDTGMSRIGFMCQEFPRDNNSIKEIKSVCSHKGLIPEGIFTHFAVADDGEQGEDFTRRQYENFTHTVDALEDMGIHFEIRHCSNSGAIIDYKEMRLDMVRAGIILYGYAPSDKLREQLDLRPAMRLKTMISHIKTVRKGATVSYGRTFTAERDMRIATVPVGYADGFIRSYAKDGYMFVWDPTRKFGKNCKIVGRICMDQTMLDVTDFPQAELSNIVVVFGNGHDGEPTAEDVARWGDTISYEVLCAVSKRVPRLYRYNWITENVIYKL